MLRSANACAGVLPSGTYHVPSLESSVKYDPAISHVWEVDVFDLKKLRFGVRKLLRLHRHIDAGTLGTIQFDFSARNDAKRLLDLFEVCQCQRSSIVVSHNLNLAKIGRP